MKMIEDPFPFVSLRMMTSTVELLDYQEAIESIKVMTEQEKSYNCRDYLGAIHSHRERDETNNTIGSRKRNVTIDVSCRQKMCEWCYRVCDHFQTDREIVAFAFSLLDRFVDRCCCDRKTFKLAAVTSLYMATKIFNVDYLPIKSLVELSCGEFSESHITEMESTILKTLKWRLNPPTVQAFIRYLHALLPLDDLEESKAIYERALFFAELCVYDYNFVTQDRYLIAVAALLNAMDGIDEGAFLSKDLQLEFISMIQYDCKFQLESDTLKNIRGCLWYLYGYSAQIFHDGVLQGPDQ